MPGSSDSPSHYAEATLGAYRVYADQAKASWAARVHPSPFLKHFAAQLPAKARVLDYGCGIGMDLDWLARQGLRVQGVDGASDFVEEARRRCPKARIVCARFDQAKLEEAFWDAIWCAAALIHVPPAEFVRQLAKLRQALKPGGILGLSLAWGRSKRFFSEDWIPGRYFACYTKSEVRNYFKAWDLREIRVVSNKDRKGRWIQVLAMSSPCPPHFALSSSLRT
ncbi:MAG: class I SAM-dependent methyltransferase [Candidatus Omnitrophica bacterium]|nr:class I SAM-dependent methyltransferase [Candidatus Omnitrophota bacterium]